MAVHLGELTLNCRSCLSGKKIPCEFEIPGQDIWEIAGEQYQGCPFKIVTRESANFIRAFNFYQRGYLPSPGGWLEQSAKLLDAFEVIEKELEAMKQERHRRREAFKK